MKDLFNNPYQVDTRRYRRFHQKNICFARVSWDQTFKAYRKGPVSRTEDPLTSELGKYRVHDESEMARVIKKAAQVFGACGTGISLINHDWIYTNRISGEPVSLPEGMKYAIVMLIEMDDYGLAASPAIAGGIATGNGYSRMACATACMSEFIRNLGYRAIASGNDTALSIPLAIDAGLGEFGRNGLLIHPRYGQRVRICKVFHQEVPDHKPCLDFP